MNSLLAMTALLFKLPPGLLIGLCAVESSLDPKAINWTDGGSASYGLCQIKEATAKGEGFEGDTVLLLNPLINAFHSASYLSRQLTRYGGDYCSAIAAYNAGTRRFNKRGLFINEAYVKKVLIGWKRYEKANAYLPRLKGDTTRSALATFDLRCQKLYNGAI